VSDFEQLASEFPRTSDFQSPFIFVDLKKNPQVLDSQRPRTSASNR